MEKVKYYQIQNKVMENKKPITILSIFLLILLSMFSVSAVDENMINWKFEEGSGSIALDSSGNNILGIIMGNPTYTTTYKRYGTYGLLLDGNNDYVTTTLTSQLPPQITFSIWARPTTASTNTLVSIFDDSGEQLIDFTFDINNNRQLRYKTNLLIENTVDLDTTTVVSDAYYNSVVALDFENEMVYYYQNNVLVSSVAIPNINYINTTQYHINVGVDETITKDFTGAIDEFRMYNFLLNASQVAEIYSGGEVTINVPTPEDNVDTIDYAYIINSMFPNINTSIVYTYQDIEINLVRKADCDLYIDNNLKKSFTNVLGFTYDLSTYTTGDYEYFVYCEYIENTTKYFELSDIINFSLSKPSKTVEFFMYDQEGNLLSNYDDLYLVTPCFEANELSKYYVPDREVYIQHLVNGQADFNLSYDANYEFCLLKGKINSKIDGFSLDYDLVDVTKQTELGKLFVNNDTYTYSLKTDDTDLYKVTQPEFWGKTWSALFQMIMGLLVGGLIIFIGLMAGVDKLIIVGGLIIAIGMGLSVTTFVGAII